MNRDGRMTAVIVTRYSMCGVLGIIVKLPVGR